MAQDLISLAIGRLPSAVQQDATEVVYRAAAGWKTVEIGSHLGITWRAVNSLRDATAASVVEVMRQEGTTDVEIIRSLGVPTAAVVGRNSS